MHIGGTCHSLIEELGALDDRGYPTTTGTQWTSHIKLRERYSGEEHPLEVLVMSAGFFAKLGDATLFVVKWTSWVEVANVLADQTDTSPDKIRVDDEDKGCVDWGACVAAECAVHIKHNYTRRDEVVGGRGDQHKSPHDHVPKSP